MCFLPTKIVKADNLKLLIHIYKRMIFHIRLLWILILGIEPLTLPKPQEYEGSLYPRRKSMTEDSSDSFAQNKSSCRNVSVPVDALRN